MYIYRGATPGIETHFENFSELFGSRKNIGIHFVLQAKERIAYILIRVYQPLGIVGFLLLVNQACGVLSINLCYRFTLPWEDVANLDSTVKM